jgi:hypothetical protein
MLTPARLPESWAARKPTCTAPLHLLPVAAHPKSPTPFVRIPTAQFGRFHYRMGYSPSDTLMSGCAKYGDPLQVLTTMERAHR